METLRQHGGVTQLSERMEKSLSVDTQDLEMETYQRLIQEGKDVARQGDMSKALELFKKAYKLLPSQKLENRILKIEELLSQNDTEDEEEEFINVNNSGLMLYKDLHDKLYSYQREGVAFLYGLHRDARKGGILADDMGLGKTIQVISFLSGMYDSELVKHTLLVMPTSLITNWTKEFAKWTPGMRVKEFHGTSKGERSRNLEKVQRRSGVIITTYTMLMNNWQQLSSYHGKEFTWDYVILDEAHKIKTSTTKTAKSASAIPSKNRVLLTGTPVQNNLREMWALFDFACQGTLLGTAKTFKSEFENPITRARERDATPGEKALGCRMSENLMTIIKPYFLRRTKADVQKNKVNGTQPPHQDHQEDLAGLAKPQPDSGAAMPTLTRKNDLIVWTYLSAVQEDIYQQFISLDHIKELLMTSRSPLAELTILKKLCDHPRLLSARAIASLGLEENAAASGEADTDAHGIANIPDHTLISESGKLVFLMDLLQRLRQEGHRTLVFAHYRKVLDIIERILGNRGFKVMRLDGTITQVAERERRISLFQSDHSFSVFLLTTQVGGVGITLTAANRVVIYDPSWNPATDAQAVDRAYRIGQTENVVIYRLITCGTVEEKIYRRQVFKDSLIRQNTGDKKNPFRYFSKQELKELFTLEDTRSSSTQLQLQAMHSRHRRTDPELDRHIAHLHTMEMFGISDHDLMFSQEVHHDEAPENQEEHCYIEGRVLKARELMKAESELQMQLGDNMASSTEAAWLRQPAGDHGQKKPRKPDSSTTPPQKLHNHSSPLQVESGEDDELQSMNEGPIDLTTEDKDDGAGERDEELKQEAADVSLEVIEDSLVSEAGAAEGQETASSSQGGTEESAEAEKASAEDGSLLYVDADDWPGGAPRLSSDSEMEREDPPLTPPQNKRLSNLRMSTSSFKADVSSRVSTGTDSFQGNFNLQLEDSDLDQEEKISHLQLEDSDLDQEEKISHLQLEETDEDEEEKLLSHLQMEGTFDVDKSLSEKRHQEQETSGMNDSIVTTKRKRVAKIFDSEDEQEEQGEQEEQEELDGSFQALGASTPKSTCTPLRARRRVGANTSVASCHSLRHSIMEEMEEMDSSEAEEDANLGVSQEQSEGEEPSGETLGSEEDEEEEEEEESCDGRADAADESAELLQESSSEKMEVEKEDIVSEAPPTSEEDYDSLVQRGRKCFEDGRLDEALDVFLRAIDLKPGDVEVQLLVIQLYRQLSHRK